MIEKSLKDISWQVTEPEYREDPALSYSTLAKYEREGFEHLDTLFDRVESPSLSFGSCVDCLITDGEEAFEKQYYISDIPNLEPSVEPIVKELFKLFRNSYTNINDIPDTQLMPVISQFAYQPRWKPETRCKSVREKGQQYYQTMFMAGDKTVITQNTYNKIFACVRALKDSPQTSKYFNGDNPFSDVEKCFQLKFKGTLGDHPYRIMADLIIVDHKNKTIIPCDLKTSSHREYDFPKSFIQWNYQIQARLYWRLIRQNMDADPYFKNFKLANYRFIVVNNIDNPVPLVWEFEKTAAFGPITLGDYKLRDPEVIGSELYYYLENRPQIPVTVSLEKNSIEEWFKRNE